MVATMLPSEPKACLPLLALACLLISFLNPAMAFAKEYTYHLDIPPDMPLQGKVNWSAEVLAPGGVTTNGVTIHSDSIDSTQVTVMVDDSVIGDIVLHASYSSSSGTLVAMKPLTIASIHPAAAQVGIELQPSPVTIVAGRVIQLDLNNRFADGSSQPIYLSESDPAQFSSSDPNVVRVDSYGEATGVSYGQANITARYRGYTTQVTINIRAPGLGPQLTRPPDPSGKVGSQFSYRITAAQNPTSFDAIGLPIGLSINKTTGEIVGTPLQAGVFTVQAVALNPSGEDRDVMKITINP